MKIIILLTSFLCLKAFAVQVAFFKEHAPSGETVVYEGEYSHAAISLNGMWFHAHPYHGITLTKNLRQIGTNYVVLENKNIPSPGHEFYKSQAYKTFNIFAAWDSSIETYCSKLIADYFKIPPTQMQFNSETWKNLKVKLPKGSLGLSPSEIYSHLIEKMNFKVIHRDSKFLACRKLL